MTHLSVNVSILTSFTGFVRPAIIAEHPLPIFTGVVLAVHTTCAYTAAGRFVKERHLAVTGSMKNNLWIGAMDICMGALQFHPLQLSARSIMILPRHCLCGKLGVMVASVVQQVVVAVPFWN